MFRRERKDVTESRHTDLYLAIEKLPPDLKPYAEAKYLDRLNIREMEAIGLEHPGIVLKKVNSLLADLI